MKIPTVLTAALAAAAMTFAAHSAERPANPAKSVSQAKLAALAPNKPGKPAGVTREECPYLFGCGDKQETDKTTTASIAKPRNPAASTGSQYGDIIAKYAMAYGVPASLAHAVIHVESNFRPNARGSAGEVGLMQIKPATARMMGYTGSVKGLFNPETNIKFGIKYLSMAHQLGGGTTCGTVLKYNAGHAAKRMNKRSSAYCAKVKRLMAGA
ncbi:MAG: transglycosylase SLT domain-containing protein [Rhizobiaceae bacterium]|jgi:soluble lytic murein transglycosylase-like protein